VVSALGLLLFAALVASTAAARRDIQRSTAAKDAPPAPDAQRRAEIALLDGAAVEPLPVET
jgi:hypothetical protein